MQLKLITDEYIVNMMSQVKVHLKAPQTLLNKYGFGPELEPSAIKAGLEQLAMLRELQVRRKLHGPLQVDELELEESPVDSLPSTP